MAAIDVLIDNIWTNYDADNSGQLDRKESQRFVKDYMQMIGCADQFDGVDFKIMFQKFDKDGSGQIEKKEMKTFIKDLTE